MKIREFLTEREFHNIGSAPMPGFKYYPSMPSSDPYQIYRFGMAMTAPQDAEYTGPAARNAVVGAYAPEEQDIIKRAERRTGHQGKRLSDPGSQETQGTNTQSPIPSRPRRKR